MVRISLLVPDEALSLIDSAAEGNRAGFMIAAAIERAERNKRERAGTEFVAALQTNADRDAAAYDEWAEAMSDGRTRS